MKKTIVFLLFLFLASGCVRKIAQKNKQNNLLEKAKKYFQPIPQKALGSEKDTEKLVYLGKKLYFEKKLSINNTISCASCHQIDDKKGGVDNLTTSPGAHGKKGGRNSPTVFNSALQIAQFWDGRAKNLTEQAKGPILNPIEMAMPNEKAVVEKLQNISAYKTLFEEAFSSKNALTYNNIAKAIAAFERTLLTTDRFDNFLKGDEKALSSNEKKGLKLFIEKGCVTCHNGPLLGGNMYQKLGLVNGYPENKDKGRFEITKDKADEYVFKVPTLRNISLTSPYFHSGQIKTLEEAVEKMAWLQLGQKLTKDEISFIVSFLKSLEKI